jgi:hypothetical protein
MRKFVLFACLLSWVWGTSPFESASPSGPYSVDPDPLETMGMSRTDPLNELLDETLAARFLDEFWEQKHVHVKRDMEEYFSRLIPIAALDAILDSSCHIDHKIFLEEESGMEFGPDGDFNLVKRVTKEDGEVWTASPNIEASLFDKTSRSEFAHEAFSKGFSLVINRMNYRWPMIYQICELLARKALGFRLNVNLYFTPANSQGFEAHFDWMEAFVLQIEGSKHWKLREFSNHSIRLPFPEQKFKPANDKLGSVVEELRMNPGDVLYIPSGMIHEAETISTKTSSVHLTIGMEIDLPFTWIGVILRVLHQIDFQSSIINGIPEKELVSGAALYIGATVTHNWRFRRAVPFGFWFNASDTESRSLVLEELNAKLEATANVVERNQWSLADLSSTIQRFQTRIAPYFPTWLSNMESLSTVQETISLSPQILRNAINNVETLTHALDEMSGELFRHVQAHNSRTRRYVNRNNDRLKKFIEKSRRKDEL